MLMNSPLSVSSFSSLRLLSLSKALGICMLASLLLISACASPGLENPDATLQVWDVAGKKNISLNALAERSRAADFVLIGETHDNPVHHQIQHRLLQVLSADGKRPALVMEQFDFEQQTAIDIAMSPQTSRIVALQALQREMGPGWEWPQYRALIDTAKERDLSLKAANLSRDRLQQVSKRGFGALGAGEATRLALDVGWTTAQQVQLEQTILDGHCGVLPVKAATAIANAQRARDAMMADALLAVRADTAVAIFGSEHVRRDLSVPLYLAARAPTRRTVVIGLIDADAGQVLSSEEVNTMERRFDYWVVTPSVQRKVDPCAGLVMPAMETLGPPSSTIGTTSVTPDVNPAK